MTGEQYWLAKRPLAAPEGCLLYPSKLTLIDGIELPATNVAAPPTPATPKLMPGQPLTIARTIVTWRQSSIYVAIYDVQSGT